MKVICRECNWIGDSADLLTAPNPFDAENDLLTGCPQCKEVDMTVQFGPKRGASSDLGGGRSGG